MRAPFFACIALLVTWASAQTITTTNALGQSVIEVVTTDPIALTPTTSIIQTLTSVSTATTTSSSPAPVDPGPVQQPAPTGGPQTPTIYTYTTTNAAGVTTAVVDTFTPTYYQSAVSPPPWTGTVLQYSSWLAIVGTNTAVSVPQASGARIPVVSGGWYGMVVAALSGVLGGAWLLLV